jgi:putative DNA primase/helicase
VSIDAAVRAVDAGDLDLARAADAAWEALEADNVIPYMFRYGGIQSRVETDDQGATVVRSLTPDRLRYILARIADWYTERKGKRSAAHPPIAVVRDMLARPDPPLPILHRVVPAPVFAQDGNLCLTSGYHASARAYVALAPGLVIPRVPDAPDASDVRVAVAVIDELVRDFPFVCEASRANAFAVLLLPFVRDFITGPTPLALIEKPTPGTGATLLATVLVQVATGRQPGLMTEGRDEDEWRKRITANLLASPVAIPIDNIRRKLDSASLSAAITSTEWTDRVLGRSEVASIPIRCVWLATGNNPALSAEMARRTFSIRLDARVERPWQRAGFRHADLVGWAAEHRGELIAAALTLGRAWLIAGRPAGATTLGMFESWARVMGGILDVAAVPGFLGNLTEFYDAADAEGTEVRAFLAAWWDKHRDAEMEPGRLFELATTGGSALDIEAKSEQGRRVKFGQRLASLRDRRYDLDGLSVMVTAPGKVRRALTWQLLRCESGELLPALSPNGHGESVSLGESVPKRPYERVGNLYMGGPGKDSLTLTDSQQHGATS